MIRKLNMCLYTHMDVNDGITHASAEEAFYTSVAERMAQRMEKLAESGNIQKVVCGDDHSAPFSDED